MPESKWAVKNGKIRIYGVLNKGKKKNTKAILYVHGLTGHAYDYAATVMANSFPAKGYDVIRLYLYHWNEDARQLSDCTLAIHGADVTAVVKHFKKKYKQVFACGHSYGVPSLLFSKTELLDGMAFWDGSVVPSLTLPDDKYKQTKDGQIWRWGFEPLIGNGMLKHSAKCTPAFMKKLIGKCKTPTLVVEASEGMWYKMPYKFMDWLGGEKKNLVIRDSVHCFYEEGTTAPLMRATKRWFDRFWLET